MSTRKSSASSVSNSLKPATKSFASTSSKPSVQVKKSSDKPHKTEEIKLEDDVAMARYESMMSKLSETSIKEIPNDLIPITTTKHKETHKELSKIINPAKDLDEKKVKEESSEDTDVEDADDAILRRKAPNELLEEFLVYVMQKNWKDAHKLCKFILMYEPKNKTAKEFLPLIETKLQMNESDTSSEETNSDDEDDDSDDDEDSDEDSDDNDDSDSDSDSENENAKKPHLNKQDIKSIKTTNIRVNGNHK